MIDVHFTFRLSPNDIVGRDYCEHKLKLISQDLYSLDFGNKNLYDVFMVSTAHITAYSSCCYEAAIFNVPTLLFGKESRDIYEDEIRDGFFKWTDGNVPDLSTWISNLKDNNVSCSNYIKTTN
jgi:CDP-glycerol glycerophosphotransferase (TagB/SpsB family)